MLACRSNLFIWTVHHLVHVALRRVTPALSRVGRRWAGHSAVMTSWVSWGGCHIAIFHQLVANLILSNDSCTAIWAIAHIVISTRVIVLQLLHLNYWGLIGGVESILDLLCMCSSWGSHHACVGTSWTHIRGHVIVHPTAWLLLLLLLLHLLLAGQLWFFLG